MKKIALSLLSFSHLISSEVITVDSLFKKNSGFRSITKFSLLSNGGENRFVNYPNVIALTGKDYQVNSKSVILNQTVLYGVSERFDFIGSFSGSFVSVDKLNKNSRVYSENSKSFNSINANLSLNYLSDSLITNFSIFFNSC